MRKTLEVEGMMCGHCEAHVKEALEKVPGVVSAKADHGAGTAVVELSGEVADAALVAAVEACGYKVGGVSAGGPAAKGGLFKRLGTLFGGK